MVEREQIVQWLRASAGSLAENRESLTKLDAALGSILDLFSTNAKEGESLSVRLEIRGKEWRITLEAAVTGLEPELADRLFDPYVRARPGDVGRGLAFARAVFQAHGGDLVARLKGGRLRLRGDALRNPPGGE